MDKNEFIAGNVDVDDIDVDDVDDVVDKKIEDK